MKFGAIISSCVVHDVQEHAWEALRQHSEPETVCTVIFNGLAPRPLPPGFTAAPHFVDRVAYEGRIWHFALTLARREHWDWCALLHDDMILQEPGWEESIRAGAAEFRIGLAGWCTYTELDRYAQTMHAARSPRLRVFADGCGLVFWVPLWKDRESFTTLNFDNGYGDHEVAGFVLGHEHAVWHIDRRSHHAGGVARRALHDGVHSLPGEGPRIAWKRHEGVLPAQVIFGDRLMLGPERRVVPIRRSEVPE